MLSSCNTTESALTEPTDAKHPSGSKVSTSFTRDTGHKPAAAGAAGPGAADAKPAAGPGAADAKPAAGPGAADAKPAAGPGAADAKPAAGPEAADAKPAADASGRDDEPTVAFTCHLCGLSERCHYHGARPPFTRAVQPVEASYVLRDPFEPRGRGQLLLLGSDCALCGRAVCQDAGCSVFYTRRFCLPCARARADEFPAQLRARLAPV